MEQVPDVTLSEDAIAKSAGNRKIRMLLKHIRCYSIYIAKPLNAMIPHLQKITVFLFGLLLFSLPSFSQDFKKIPDKKVSDEKVALAKRFIQDFFSALSSDSFYDFSEKATEKAKAMFTPEAQKKIYNQAREKYGQFKEADYAGTWIEMDNPDYYILRYKGDFSKGTEETEIRVVLTEKNKIAGFFVRPWSNTFN